MNFEHNHLGPIDMVPRLWGAARTCRLSQAGTAKDPVRQAVHAEQRRHGVGEIMAVVPHSAVCPFAKFLLP